MVKWGTAAWVTEVETWMADSPATEQTTVGLEPPAQVGPGHGDGLPQGGVRLVGVGPGDPQLFFFSASGLCTASRPLLSLFTRYCGSSSDAATVRPASSVRLVIFLSTSPVVVLPWLDHSTLSPFENSLDMRQVLPEAMSGTRRENTAFEEDSCGWSGRQDRLEDHGVGLRRADRDRH